MDKRAVTKFVGIVVTFIVLIIGYIYFNEQSILSSGKSNADTIIQNLEDGDVASVKNRLDEFVGGIDPARDIEYQQALTSIDYVVSQIESGSTLKFVDSDLGDSGEYRIFAGIYEIAAPQGGEDYLIVTMRRQDSSWILSNMQLAALNPLAEESN